MNISAYALMRADFCITPICINSGVREMQT